MIELLRWSKGIRDKRIGGSNFGIRIINRISTLDAIKIPLKHVEFPLLLGNQFGNVLRNFTNQTFSVVIVEKVWKKKKKLSTIRITFSIVYSTYLRDYTSSTTEVYAVHHGLTTVTRTPKPLFLPRCYPANNG